MSRLRIIGFLAVSACGGFFLPACGGSKSEKKASKDADATAAPYVLEYQDVMEFTRGVQDSYKIAGRFTNEEVAARLTIDALPEGAVYEGEALSWTPSCDLKPENGQFQRGYLVRRVRINLTSTVSDQVVQKPAILIVHKDGEQSPCGG